MIKEFIGTGKTVEEATAAAKAGLNAPPLATINIEVISMPKKKTLGLFGGHDAEVKAWYEEVKKERKPRAKKESAKKTERKPLPKKETAAKPEAPKAPQSHAVQAPVIAPVQDEAEIITEKDVDMDDAVAYVKNILKGLLIDDAEVTAKIEDGVLVMEIQCGDFGIIIGRRGETLDSIQYLTSLAVKKKCGKYVRVAVNVGNYREKRTETLINLAQKNANYVLRTGRRYTFEPMNPYERRIIHTAVQEIEGVESISVGYGQDRRVMLHSTNHSAGPRRSYGGNYSSSASSQIRTAPRADRADLPKFGKIEINRD